MALHDNLKEARQRMGMSQEMVAEHLDISRQAVTKWELGQSRPNAKNLRALAALYHTSAEELLADRTKKEANYILRANLTKWAIIAQSAFLYSVTCNMAMLRSYPMDKLYRGEVIFNLVLLLLASTWMTLNHRYEPDLNQRRKMCVLSWAIAAFRL